MDFLTEMESRLTAEDRRFLSDIFEPREVAVPDEDAWRGLCVTRDGRIRFYGAYGKKNVFDTGYERCFLESGDCGLSWKRHLCPKTALGASVYVPFTDRYLRTEADKTGTYALVGTSPDDEAPVRYPISAVSYLDLRAPVVLRRRKRILAIGHERRPEIHPTAIFSVLFLSDDGGQSWRTIPLPAAPLFEPKPGEGCRWQQGCRENTVAEREDGSLLMLARTALDHHVVSESRDGGESWTPWRESLLHGTATMPQLLSLSDGKLLLAWCNTRLMPELPDADGVWEDYFTNRDANHAAISEDGGKSWIGMREMALNPLRTAADFRSAGGSRDNRDKSVHQFELLELPMGKILAVYGQAAACRRIVIFDRRWLYETAREERFLSGLAAVSTQTFVRSIPGGFRGTPDDPLEFAGHCAYNRTDGALLVPSPDDDGHEVLQLTVSADPRVVTPRGGAVWNFPAMKHGTVRFRASVPGGGLRVSLCDHHLQPGDETVADVAVFSAVLPVSGQARGAFCDYALRYDDGTVTLTKDGEPLFCRENPPAPLGISYLHLQAAADAPDPDGALIARLSAAAD